MLDLDHDFYLFRDAETGLDMVVHLREDGRIGLLDGNGRAVAQRDETGLVLEPRRFTDPMTLEAAVSEMDVLGHEFMFFVDAESGRGNVIYMRYDGHYGLIEPRV